MQKDLNDLGFKKNYQQYLTQELERKGAKAVAYEKEVKVLLRMQ